MKYFRDTLFAVALLGCLAATAGAQAKAPVQSQGSSKAAPTPRTKDGHPDLTGIFWPGDGNPDLRSPTYQRKFDPKVTPQEPVPFQPWAAEKIKQMGDVDTNRKLCQPIGVPGFMMSNPYPVQIVQTPKQVVMLREEGTTFRVIYMNQPIPKNPDPMFNGTSVGHWEGDTLVVDVAGVDEETKVDNRSWFHSDAMHVIERYRRPDANTLIYQVTVEDPKVLTKPWTSPPHRWTASKVPLLEYYCTNELQYDKVNQK